MVSTLRALSGVIPLVLIVVLQVASISKTPTTWKVSQSNVTCILFRASITLSVNYTDVHNHNQTHLVQLDIPSSARASGNCGEEQQQSIVLSWDAESNSTIKPQGLNNSLTFDFLANSTGNASSITSISGHVPHGLYAIVKVTAILHKIPEIFPNATNPTAPFILKQEATSSFLAYPTSLNHSYVCGSVLKIDSNTGSGTSTPPQLTVSLDQSQVEAFRKGKEDEKFGEAEHCPADEISSGSVVGTVILTISVIVLLALGVAALATYVLMKRRANGGSGYENM